MKKLVSILMAAVLLLCAVPVLAEGQTYTVGVCQLVTHDALDAATQGFIDALTEELGMCRTPQVIPTPARPSSIPLWPLMWT